MSRINKVQNILVLGVGELGIEVLRALTRHPSHGTTSISAFIRATPILSTSPKKVEELDELRQLGVRFVLGNITNDSEEELASIFRDFDLVISCMGFVSGGGIQLKITRAVLSAEVPKYIPWQFGIDYDVIGRGSAQPLFDEQLDVRDMLRGQTRTKWVIISTGMFTSFLFEPTVGIINTQQATARALGSWANRVTITAPEDIGKLTAEVVLGDDREELFANKPIYVAGDTITYQRAAEIAEKVMGRSFRRTVLTVEDAMAAIAKDPDNSLNRYNVVFGEGRGVAWDLSETWNYKAGIRAATAEEWAMVNLL
ncbi:hypothetical protein FQN57_005770 [Myotisia sp. PD_48]|nr:hypothetical protein FQN57_005770 [Myotisia sp. PD_48]